MLDIISSTINMYCQHCGNKLQAETKFCSNCGAEVGKNLKESPAEKVDAKATLATSGQRLANYFIDRIAVIVLIVILAYFNEYIAILSLVAYYIVCELLWQKTLGKLLTGTKVVNEKGAKPSVKQIIGRSFARFIPFETLTFLSGGNPAGWHDTLSNTYVVPDDVTEEIFQKIDLEEMKKTRSNGVVIIVGVFVAIAFIGILSSVVLASLSTARGKGNDAKVKAQLSGLRAAAEIYYDTNNNSYGPDSNSCADGMFSDMSSGMSNYTNLSNYPEGVEVNCLSGSDGYAAAATLPGVGGAWCVDSSGASKAEASALITGYCQ